MTKLPEYTDGYFQLFKITSDNTNDFPVEMLINQKMDIWFRELSVFDHTVYELGQGGIEVTMKVRIPRYKGINSKCMCKIGSDLHRVYNAAHVISKDGFEETELTLIKPEANGTGVEE